jgi:iron complex outermembrane receptor protein
MARLYMDLNFHDDSTVAQIAPSGFFLGPSVKMFYENPLLSQAWKNVFHDANVADSLGTFNKAGDSHDLLIGRRNVEGGGRQDDVRHTSYRGVVGVKGDLNSMFSYDVFAQTGRVLFQETYKNDFSNVRMNRALDVVTDPTSGQAVCRSALDGTDPNCVPWNIWALGKVTPEALAYVQTPGFQRGFTAQTVAGASVSGDLTDMGIKSPMARSGLGFSVGFERRTEKMELSTDTAFTTGDLAGQGGPTIGVGGQYSVNEVYGEMRLPLLEKMPLAELLNLTGTFRKSSYSTNQSTTTYGVGLEYKPINALKFRGSLQKATRAANIIELFSVRSLGLYDNDPDPCSGGIVDGKALDGDGATLAQCQRTGVSAAQFGKIEDSPAGQYNLFSGGTASLKPEDAKSVTFGLVLQPMRDLSLTIDYFNIRVEDTISSIPAPVSLQQCLETGNPFFCNKIKRDAKGTLWLNGSYIESFNENIGSVETEGVDIGVDYSLKLAGLGKLDLNLVGTYLQSFVTEDVPGLETYDCAGYFGNTCGTPLPVWRNKVRATWTTPWDLQLAFTWRHIDKVELDARSAQTRLAGGTAAQVPFLASRDYIDVAASYALTKNLKLSMSVNNLFDKDPPLRTQGSGFVNGNTYPVVYDAAGRRININLNAKF